MTRKVSKAGIFVSMGRLTFLAGTLLLVFCAVFTRLYYLHVVKAEDSSRRADRMRSRFITLHSRRGDIVDCNRNLLATNRPVIELGADPSSFENTPENRGKILEIAKILNMPYDELFGLCARDSESPDAPHWRKIAEDLSDDVYAQIRQVGLKAIYGNRSYRRVYPSGEMTGHIVGYVNRNFQSVMGIELQFESALKGQDGWIETERDGRRREAAQFRTQEVRPVDGLGVELSIDLVIQEMAVREVKSIVEKFDPLGVTIIVSEPATGYILAMANYPNFDPNKYNKYPVSNLRNRAITDQYEPGSTFKIVPVAAALNESLVGPDDKFDCTLTSIEYKGRRIDMPKEAHFLGKMLTVREIVAKSSNKGVAQLGTMLGEDRLYSYARSFGYGRKTNLGLLGEISGTLLPVKNWDGKKITRVPMGQGVAATPIQVHFAMSTIANQGVYMQPQLVRRTFDAEGKTVFNYAPRPVRRVVSPKIATLMTEMLSDVVGEGGTARQAAVKGYKIAGKTGTGQKVENGRYSNTKHVGSFSGFFPAQRPRLAITVVVDEPRKLMKGWGGVVAAPSFKNIAEQAANYLGIQTDEEFEKMVAWKGFE